MYIYHEYQPTAKTKSVGAHSVTFTNFEIAKSVFWFSLPQCSLLFVFKAIIFVNSNFRIQNGMYIVILAYNAYTYTETSGAYNERSLLGFQFIVHRCDSWHFNSEKTVFIFPRLTAFFAISNEHLSPLKIIFRRLKWLWGWTLKYVLYVIIHPKPCKKWNRVYL